MCMYNFLKIFIAVVIVTFIGTSEVFAVTSNPPQPRENPFASGWGGQIMGFGIKDPEARGKLLGISDMQIKQNILNAKSGSCPAVRTSENSKVKVENAKQCGKTPEEKKKKNGKKCTATGIQGGSIDAMCLNGCCVALGIKSGKSNYFGGSGANTPSNLSGQGQYYPPNNNMNMGLMSSFMQMFRGFMGGGGTGNQSGNYYGNPYIVTPQRPVLPTTTVMLPATSTVGIVKVDTNPTVQEYNPEVVDMTDHLVNPATSTNEQPQNGHQDSIQTIISKNGVKVEVKVDKEKRPDRYAFVEPKRIEPIAPIVNHNPNGATEGENINILQREESIQVHKSESGVSHTGFKGEKVTSPQPSLMEKISVWFATLFGLN